MAPRARDWPRGLPGPELVRAGVRPPHAPLPPAAPVAALVLGALQPRRAGCAARLYAVLLAPDGEPAAAVPAPREALRLGGLQLRPWEPRPGDLVLCLPPGGDRLPHGLMLARLHPRASVEAALFAERVRGRTRDPRAWEHAFSLCDGMFDGERAAFEAAGMAVDGEEEELPSALAAVRLG